MNVRTFHKYRRRAMVQMGTTAWLQLLKQHGLGARRENKNSKCQCPDDTAHRIALISRIRDVSSPSHELSVARAAPIVKAQEVSPDNVTQALELLHAVVAMKVRNHKFRQLKILSAKLQELASISLWALNGRFVPFPTVFPRFVLNLRCLRSACALHARCMRSACALFNFPGVPPTIFSNDFFWFLKFHFFPPCSTCAACALHALCMLAE